MEKQVISKKRVTDHGEVLPCKREVNAMLDLVKQETERIESRFLEPACGGRSGDTILIYENNWMSPDYICIFAFLEFIGMWRF